MINFYDFEGYKKIYYQKIIYLLHTPFQTWEWVSFHEKYFGDKFLFLSVEDGDEFQIGVVLFCAETLYGKMYYSYGRFGTAGIVIGNCQIDSPVEMKKYVSDLIEGFKEKVNQNPVSLSIGSVQTGKFRDKEVQIFKDLCNGRINKYFSRIHHIANMKKLTNERHQLSISKFNRNISRNLKRAREYGLNISDKIDNNILKKWHEIHLERVSELGGKHWNLSFFMRLYDNNKFDSICKFFGVYSNSQIVGGAVCIYNEHILDIFMMSTLRKFQELGANHILTEKIYSWCIENRIPFVNWQGSNPPEGGLAMFKRQWLAEDSIMHSMNFVFDQGTFNTIDYNLLLNRYPDRFFFPI